LNLPILSDLSADDDIAPCCRGFQCKQLTTMVDLNAPMKDDGVMKEQSCGLFGKELPRDASRKGCEMRWFENY
jgi:hypothetical protein